MRVNDTERKTFILFHASACDESTIRRSIYLVDIFDVKEMPLYTSIRSTFIRRTFLTLGHFVPQTENGF